MDTERRLALPVAPELDFDSQKLCKENSIGFEAIRGEPNYLERLFTTVEAIGDQYAANKVDRLTIPRPQVEFIKHALIQRDMGDLEKKDKAAFDNYAVGILRDTQRLKRRIISQGITQNPESLPPMEKILLLGGLLLSEQTDDIFWDDWRPAIKDSPIGEKLKEIEDANPGAASALLPGKTDAIRWHTREWKKPGETLRPEDIKLVRYQESLAGVKGLIETLDDLTILLAQVKSQHSVNDFGYEEFFHAWARCLQGVNEEEDVFPDQKKLEDDMMIAWRNIDSDAPIFMVPWAEYAQDDPAAVAIAPSFRIGVLNTSSQAIKLKEESEEVKKSIIEFVKSQGYQGIDAIGKSLEQIRVWTGHAGLNHIISMTSQVLPNDADLRRNRGTYIFPDLVEQGRGEAKRETEALKVFTPEILERLHQLKLTVLEKASGEIAAHEYTHPVGVTQKGENRLGKLAVLIDETKSTLGGMLAQVKKHNDKEFSKRLLASCLYFSPRYLTRDGNSSHQGYGNIARIVLGIAEHEKVLTLDMHNNLVLDIEDPIKINRFWSRVESFITWAVDAYSLADRSDDKDVEKNIGIVSAQLDEWTGKAKEEDGFYQPRVITYMKQKLAPPQK
ncbi:hypothetical protein HY029_01375 [Candidatus Gottesmanbacteria bacterium]|nr:hypothetical protein [Candidatus Gottesmanbacteria bacterium]